jgi:hypothetical protein
MADEKKCKNPPCSCPPQEGGKYCSASCEGTGDTIELGSNTLVVNIETNPTGE